MIENGAMSKERKRYNEVLVPAVYEMVWESLITCNGTYALNQVELSLQWDIDDKTVIQRYVKYQDKAQFLKACVDSKPHTIQLGGVLPGFPGYGVDHDRTGRKRDVQMCKDGITSARGPLVVDIDLTDYDRSTVCECGTSKKCCNACFAKFLDPAMDVLDYIFRKAFGFSQFFFVWSGRRGIHMWVCDPQVLDWTHDQRATFTARIMAMKSDPFDEHVHRILGGNVEELFPRLDVEVSKDARHLKKLPMAMHQSTCIICNPTPPVGTGFRFRPEEHSRKPNDFSIDLVSTFAVPIKKALLDKGSK